MTFNITSCVKALYLDTYTFLHLRGEREFEDSMASHKGVFNKDELDELGATLREAGIPYQIRESERDPGQWRLVFPTSYAPSVHRLFKMDIEQLGCAIGDDYFLDVKPESPLTKLQVRAAIFWKQENKWFISAMDHGKIQDKRREFMKRGPETPPAKEVRKAVAEDAVAALAKKGVEAQIIKWGKGDDYYFLLVTHADLLKVADPKNDVAAGRQPARGSQNG